jgi:hypothetical protein
MKEKQIEDITIESGVPLPPRFANGTGMTAAFRAMKPGDSFFHKGNRVTPANLARQAGIKVAIRKEGDGFRIWKV